MILIHMQDGSVSAVTTDDGDLAGQEIVVLDERPWVLRAILEEDISRAVSFLRAARDNTIDNVLKSALKFAAEKVQELSTKSHSEIVEGLSEISGILIQARRLALNIEKRNTTTSATGIILSA